jgi:hypothetical protein
MNKSEIKVSSIIEMAKICAELTRENIIYEAKRYSDSLWVIEITGY